MNKIILRAYAKINLSLEILEKRSDGYHNLHSIVQAVDLFDTLTITKTKRDFILTGSKICDDKNNLIVKAHEAMEKFVGKKMACAIHLTKVIPIAAGLGGGSSDAAATIIGLNKLFDAKLDKRDLIKIALTIGSDVPYFVSGYGRARVGGRGEIIKRDLGKSAKFYVLARSHKRISTKAVFDLYDKEKKPFIDLVSKLCTKTKEIYQYLSSQSKECGLSGSGPTVFAGFSSYVIAKRVIEKHGITRFNGDFFIVRPVDRPIFTNDESMC